MAVPSAQGTRVYFGGRLIGRVASCKTSQSTGTEFDCTNMLSPIVGTGANTRIVRQVNPVDVAPVQVVLELFGAPQFTRDDLCRIATLTVRTRRGTLSGSAYLANFDFDQAAGEKMKSTATFKFTGF